MDRVALGATKDVHPGTNHFRQDVSRFKLLLCLHRKWTFYMMAKKVTQSHIRSYFYVLCRMGGDFRLKWHFSRGRTTKSKAAEIKKTSSLLTAVETNLDKKHGKQFTGSSCLALFGHYIMHTKQTCLYPIISTFQRSKKQNKNILNFLECLNSHHRQGSTWTKSRTIPIYQETHQRWWSTLFTALFFVRPMLIFPV